MQKDIQVEEDGVTLIKVKDTMEALARYSSRFYGEPSKKIRFNWGGYRH